MPLPRPSPDNLQNGDECRRLMVQATAHELRKDRAFRRRLPAADWDAAVPHGVEALVVGRAAALPDGCRGCRCEVSFCVHVDFVYDEAAELLRACAEAGGDTAGTSSSGVATPCAICFEEMAPGAATWLPGCAHGFHAGCVGRWFKNASTCLVCRRDKLQYLPPAYRAARDMILSYAEDSC